MKRILAFLLAALLLAGMGASAFAETWQEQLEREADNWIVGPEGSKELEVKGKYAAGEEEKTVYSVTVEWQSFSFDCTISGEKKWNPESHTYTDTRSLDIDQTDIRTITVTNHSNVPVEIQPQLVSPENDLHVSVLPTGGTWQNKQLASGTNSIEHPEHADHVQYSINLAKSSNDRPDFDKLFNDGLTKTFDIGKVTITVAPVAGD